MRASVASGSAVAICRCSTAYSLANAQASASSAADEDAAEVAERRRGVLALGLRQRREARLDRVGDGGRRAPRSRSRASPPSRSRARPRSAGRRRAASGSAESSARIRLSLGPCSMFVATPCSARQQLCHGHGRAARPDDLAHARDRGGAEHRRGDAARAVDAPDLAQARAARRCRGRPGRRARSRAAAGRARRRCGTPATAAGTPRCAITDGKEPLPQGT